MSYKLPKPYTSQQKNEFIITYNHRLGLRIEETETALYALEPNEIMQDDVPVIDPTYEEHQIELRKQTFFNDFFEVKGFGYYRIRPKGYQSAVESMNVLFNAALVTNGIQAGLIIFYPEPDFTKPEQCTEEWLVANQIIMPAMTKEEFMQLWAVFTQAWNTKEHEQKDIPEEPQEELNESENYQEELNESENSQEENIEQGD